MLYSFVSVFLEVMFFTIFKVFKNMFWKFGGFVVSGVKRIFLYVFFKYMYVFLNILNFVKGKIDFKVVGIKIFIYVWFMLLVCV